MRDGLTRLFMNYLTGIVVVLVVLVGMVLVYPNWRSSQRLVRQQAENQERIELKKREIAQLKEYQRRFRTDPDFIEKIARQNRRVYPGELIFLFED